MIDIAIEAASVVPAHWERADDRLVGTLPGGHGNYNLIIEASSDSIARIEVILPGSVSEGNELAMVEACVQANRDWPGTRLHCTGRFGGSVVSAGSIMLGRTTGELDPMLLRMTLLRCIASAAAIPPLVAAIERGESPSDAPGFASDPRIVVHASRTSVAPADDAALIDACIEGAEGSGWISRRLEPGMNSAHFIVPVRNGGRVPLAFVNARHGCVYASTILLDAGERQRVPAERRAAVAQLLNGLAEQSSLCSFAFDLESGLVRADSFIDTTGSASPPSPALLCDIVLQAAGAWPCFREVIVRVAHGAVDPAEALADLVSG